MQQLTGFSALAALAAKARSGAGRVFIPAAAAEPAYFADLYRQQPDLAEHLTFVSIGFPGANDVDWASLSPSSRAEGTFIGEPWRKSFETGRFDLRPLGYSVTGQWLETTPIDAALIQVSPPDADGLCAFGTGVDFAPLVLARKPFIVAQINPLIPNPKGAWRVPMQSFDITVEQDHPLFNYDPGSMDPAFDAIASHLADLTPDGATLQFGLGKAALAALRGLTGRSGMAVHSGMISGPTLDAIDAGILDKVTTGAALGQGDFYQRLEAYDQIRYVPVTETHSHAVLASIPRLVAVNSALEVDLLGQANAEFLNGRQISGIGGLLDFLRGAAASPGGVPIVALNATAKSGQVSRIIPRLQERAVSVPRYDMGVVVTEFGIADLRGRTLDERAEAMIGIAAPQHRDSLQAAWHDIRRSL